MKGFIIVAVLAVGCVLLGSYFLTGQVVDDQGRQMAVAFGGIKNKTIQFHIAVAPGIPIQDPPELRENLSPNWEKWVADHYQLRDETGNSVPMQRMGTSSLMNDRAAGSPEFVVWGTVEMGKDYTCDFVSKLNRYRLKFTAPTEPKKVGQLIFDPVSADDVPAPKTVSLPFRLVGVHSVKGVDSCHLVEIEFNATPSNFDWGQVTQERDGQPRDNWQVAWDERPIDPDEKRWAFFFHHLEFSRPLLTPLGSVKLPPATELPDHLKGIKYEKP